MTLHLALSSSRIIGIGDLAELVGVSHRALRYYEAEGLIAARRDRFNVRYFDGKGRDRVLLVVRLRRAGLSLKDIRALLSRHDRGEPIAAFARERMRSRLEALEQERRDLLSALQDLGSLEGTVPRLASVR